MIELHTHASCPDQRHGHGVTGVDGHGAVRTRLRCAVLGVFTGAPKFSTRNFHTTHATRPPQSTGRGSPVAVPPRAPPHRRPGALAMAIGLPDAATTGAVTPPAPPPTGRAIAIGAAGLAVAAAAATLGLASAIGFPPIVKAAGIDEGAIGCAAAAAATGSFAAAAPRGMRAGFAMAADGFARAPSSSLPHAPRESGG